MSYYGQYPYPQPPAQVYQQPYAPPPQTQWNFNDPNVFRPYFRSALQALTFNSRDIIGDVTRIAEEHKLRMSTIVAAELEEHIRQCPPYMKLPAMYLMDSIAKNLGEPYITLFNRFVERLFLQVYRELDPQQQIKMEQLLGTWRTGGPNGTQLYPASNGRVQRNLEEVLFGKGGRGGGIGGGGRGMLANPHYVMSVQQRPSAASPEECAALSEDIRRVIVARQIQLANNPTDATAQLAIDALEKLDRLVSSVGVSSEQIHQIRTQVSDLAPPEPAPPSPVLPDSSVLESLSQIDPSTLSSILASANQPVASTSKAAASDAVYDQALSNIDFSAISSLDPALLASLGVALGADQKEQQDKQDEYEAKLFRDFDKAKGKFGLSTQEINKSKGDMYPLLYDELSLQCTQCSARWLDTPRHRKVLQQHLDRHFRTNNRLASATRAQSRAWFVLADDWVCPTFSQDREQEEQEETLNLVEIAKSRVVAPTDPAKANKPCPICKEGFKSEWDEAKEEWVWIDAKKVDKTIYHATCHAEMMKARETAKLIKEELETTPAPGTPPVPEEPAAAATEAPSDASGAPEPPVGQVDAQAATTEQEAVQEEPPENIKEEPSDDPVSVDPLPAFQLDSDLLHAVANIVQRNATPDSDPATRSSSKRPAEDEGGEQAAKKAKGDLVQSD